MRIALVSCSKSKQNYTCAASKMYKPSKLFYLSYEYAKQNADMVYILSAKYGLLKENDIIDPYNITLSRLSYVQKKAWAEHVISQLREECDLVQDEFVILTGREYYQLLLPSLLHYHLPLDHMPLGKRVAYLKRQLSLMSELKSEFVREYINSPTISNMCEELHCMFNAVPRYSCADAGKIPFNNGIYIVFEAGETFGSWNRIVRIGTHTSKDRLKGRLRDHFSRENKDGSIFRKNVGKAILNRINHTYLPIWSLDTSKPENRIFIDFELQREIEKEVSKYLEQNFSFAVFPVEDNQLRLRLEEGIIATLHQNVNFKASGNWLGNYSPEGQIRSGGMWLKNGLGAQSLTDLEMINLKTILKSTFTTAQSDNKKSHIKEISKSKSSPKPLNCIIRKYIEAKFEHARQEKCKSCVLVSGEIHRALGLESKMPSVCNVMYQLMRDGDEIMHTTPSGKSSTIKIKYYL